MDGKEVNSGNLRAAKEQWLDKLRYKKIKLDKYVEKGNRKKDNIMFQKNQKSFFRTLEKVEKHKGEIPEMEKFVKFWGGIWDQNEPTPNMPWMEEVKAGLSEKANIVSQFGITEEKLRKETSKRKNWTAPGIDGIQNYWSNLDFGSITPQTLVCLTLLIKLKLALRKDYSQVWF